MSNAPAVLESFVDLDNVTALATTPIHLNERVWRKHFRGHRVYDCEFLKKPKTNEETF